MLLFWIEWHTGSMNLQSLMRPNEVAGKHWLCIMNVEEKLAQTWSSQVTKSLVLPVSNS